MTKIHVKNISGQELAIPNVGNVPAGETVEVEKGFHNSNFEIVETATRESTRRETRRTESKESESEKS